LYKTIDLTSRCDNESAKRAFAAATECIRNAGGDPDYDLFYDEPSDTPYEAYRPDAGNDDGNEVMVVDTTGGVSHFAAISPMTQALNRQLMFRRIHFKAEWRELVRGAVDQS
jgi:hypothetical protein